MGAFFRSEYDLFLEIKKDPESFMSNSILSLQIAGRLDLEADIKDAVVETVSCSDLSEVQEVVKSLMGIMEDGFGISTTVEKRN